MSHSKKIGIVGWKSQEHFGVSVPYANYFSRFGEVKILTPSLEIDDTLDLVVLPGGPDLYTKNYNAIPGFTNSNIDLYKQYFFDNNLNQYIEAGIPIFGICLGLQQLNVFFGGTLRQDMISKVYSSYRAELVEELNVNTEAVIHYFKPVIDRKSINLKQKVKVNSMHHQCIGKLSDQFDVIASSKELDNIEAIFHKTLPIGAVQWHPEETNGDFISFSIISTLLA